MRWAWSLLPSSEPVGLRAFIFRTLSCDAPTTPTTNFGSRLGAFPSDRCVGSERSMIEVAELAVLAEAAIPVLTKLHYTAKAQRGTDGEGFPKGATADTIELLCFAS